MALGWALISTGKHADALIAPAIGLAEGTQFVALYSREQIMVFSPTLLPPTS